MGGSASLSRRPAVPVTAEVTPAAGVGMEHVVQDHVADIREEPPALEVPVRTSTNDPANTDMVTVDDHNPNSHRNEGPTLSMAIALTPREHSSSRSQVAQISQHDVLSVPYTPHGDEANVFKYYCPLCMQYFREIMKMKCCGNYLCIECCKDYTLTKKVNLTTVSSIAIIEERFISTNTIPCPHCGVSGFHPMSVNIDEMVRDYSSRYNPTGPATNPGYSPLRIGESFEDLKRKMIPYKSQQTIVSVGDEVTPRDDEVVHPYEPQTPQHQVHSAGIAMTHEGAFSPPQYISPRVRLEPATPDFQPRYAVLDDDKPVAQMGLFSDDMSGPFAHEIAEEKCDYPLGPRAEMLALPITGIAMNALEESGEYAPSPNEIRFGSPSPRYAGPLTPRREAVPTASTSSSALYSFPQSATTSTSTLPRLPSGRRDGRDGRDGVTAQHGGVNSNGSGGSGSGVSVNMSVFASGVVEQLLRNAVSQHRPYATQ